MRKRVRIPILIVLFLALIFFRSLASRIFYDPFVEFFKNDYLTGVFPDYDAVKLSVHLLFRYVINTMISLGIIYLVFMKRNWVIFSIKFYSILFLILMLVYILLLKTEFSNGYLLAFYVRRMLIHPVFLILLLPAFYYQRKLNSKISNS